ncbi:MAG: hypothetical protein VYA23_03610 [Candidatus Thermoplasmatota archaeon]|nr:hypothetical protein [Candidatus Thermoplasmatota archaeon]
MSRGGSLFIINPTIEYLMQSQTSRNNNLGLLNTATAASGRRDNVR